MAIYMSYYYNAIIHWRKLKLKLKLKLTL